MPTTQFVTLLVLVSVLAVGCMQEQPPAPAARPRTMPPTTASTPAKTTGTEPAADALPDTSADTNPVESTANTADQDRVAGEVQGLGGQVSRNNTPGNPIYGVRVTGKKADVAALVAAIKSLDQLQEVSLDRAELTDADLAPLGILTGITTLDLSGNAITDAGLAQLKPLSKLEVLRISQNQITDAALPAVAELKNLKKLFLGRNPITNDGLANLKELTKLEELNLNACSGIGDPAFAHLEQLPNLKEVWVPFTRVTDQGASAFKQKRPEVTIEK